jgi:hypothetical protein
MESNFIVKVFNPITGQLGQEKLFNNLAEAIEFKNSETTWGYPAKVYRFVEFHEVNPSFVEEVC